MPDDPFDPSANGAPPTPPTPPTPPEDRRPGDLPNPAPGEPPRAPPAEMSRTTDFAKQVVPRPIESELRQSFLDYAMSVIVARALPDARDGLKPVHRRILYAMSELGLGHTQSYKKSARVVGEVLGKFHPHGDSAVYDAMVRMAQDWSLRYPMVDGQGNFGSVDGDSAAAMRYTEARLAKVASQMLADLDKDTVEWGPNFDGSLEEPLVLPGALPNLLINGADGIAVGMATKIAPHNLAEIVDACVRLIDEPGATPLDLLEHVQGPDFPTGGIIHGRSGILQALVTGRGRLVVRGRHVIEQMGADRERIVFLELPYQVNKAQLLMLIAELAKDKVIEGISDLRDESDRRGMRMVIELKRDAITDVVLNQLWKHTPLQSTFSINNLALVDGRPRTLGLRDLLRTFLDHRMVVVTRRTRHDLRKAEARAHILEGLLIALDRLDEVIELIRTSRDPDEARARLMGQSPEPQSALRLRPQGAGPLVLSEEQAKAILDMRLQRLTGLESDAVRSEHAELRVKIAHLKDLLGDEGKRYAVIKDELVKVKAEFGDARRTAIEEGEIDIDDESLIPEEESVFMHTDAGYLKRMPLATYREQRRGGKGLRGFKAKDEDHVVGTVVASTHDWLCVFTNHGRIHWVKGYRVPVGSRQGRGKPVVNLLQFEEGEMVETIIPVRDFEEPGAHVFFATKKGIVKRTRLNLFKNIRAAGIHAIDLLDGDELLAVRRTDGQREVLLATRKGQAVRFPETEVRSMGRTATGVRGITLEDGDEVVSLEIAEEGVEILTVTERGYGKRTPIEEYRRTHRGGKGVRTIVVNERNGGVVAVRSVHGDESVLVTTKEGMVVRSRVGEVSRLGRSTQGVRIMRIDPTDQVNQVAVLPPGEEDESVPEATPEAPLPEDVMDSPEAPETPETPEAPESLDEDAAAPEGEADASPGDDEE